MNNQTLGLSGIINETNLVSTNNICKNIGKRNEWKRNCPKCNRELIYSRKDHLQRAINNSVSCHKCQKHSPVRIVKDFRRTCPNCGKERIYSSNGNLKRAVINNSKCCGINKYKRSKEEIDRLNAGRVLKCSGINHPCFNTHRSENTRNKISISLKGKRRPMVSEETRRKFRIANLKRLTALGIGTGTDAGAPQWFYNYNKITNSKFIPKRFMNIGYDADGYDEYKHIWIEYDTSYHKIRCQKEKDMLRENRIIQHFIDTGEPLVAFLRVIAYDNEKLITKYRGYGY